MNPLRVVVVDDEPLARERVSALVGATVGLELVAEAGNGLEALDLITALQPELVFIDVEMPELSGFGVIAALGSHPVPGVVFVTAFEHYALRAFEVGAIDYLRKPVTKQRFAAAVERARERLNGPAANRRRAIMAGATQAELARGFRSRFVVLRGTTHHFVGVSEVDWIDGADNYLRLHAGAATHLWRGTMKEAEAELDPTLFVRIHRGAIVALDRVAAIRGCGNGVHEIELRTGDRIRSGRMYDERVRALLR